MLLDQLRKIRNRFDDVLLRAVAHLQVHLLRRTVRRLLRALVGDRQQILGDIIRARDQELRQRAGLAGRPLVEVRLNLAEPIVEQ